MNIVKNTKKVILPAIFLVTSMMTVNTVFANNTINVKVGSSSTANITNLSANMIGNTISVSGKMKRSKQGHVVFAEGKVNLELFDKAGNLLKTVSVTPRRHRHYVNQPYKFSSRIDMAAHNVSKVVVTYK